jgi:hypothetical protein
VTARLDGLTLRRLIVGVASVIFLAALVATLRTESDWSGSLPLVAVLVVTMALGEASRLVLPGRREAAPVTMASALALLMSGPGVGGGPHLLPTPHYLVACAVGLGAGALLRRLRRRRVDFSDICSRYFAVALAAVLYRDVPIAGRTAVDAQMLLEDQRWLVAVLMLVVSAIAVMVELVLTALCRAEREHAPLGPTVRDEVGAGAVASLALVTTGPLIALAERAMGLAAVPLFLFPLVLTLFAARRFILVRNTYRETIRALSRLTDIAGLTRPLHASRVARLAVSMGRDLGMTQREVVDLEFAALLHDLGQVGLREPIPGGATVLAAPVDQQRIADDGVRIIRETGVLDAVASSLAVQTVPFRQTREFGEDLPLAGRIIKVANAYDDLVADKDSSHASERALERIHLGLGYEYDPAVVDSLVRVLERRRSAPGRSRT